MIRTQPSCRASEAGLSGTQEKQAFESMRPVPPPVTQQLMREMMDCLLPAAEQAEFDRFGESVYRYGVTAGRCFAQRQAGAFATERLARWIQTMRQLGVRFVHATISMGPRRSISAKPHPRHGQEHETDQSHRHSAWFGNVDQVHATEIATAV